MAKLYNLKKGEAELTDLKDVTVTAAQLNALVEGGGSTTGEIADATITVVIDDAYNATITIQLLDGNDDPIDFVAFVLVYLSDEGVLGAVIISEAPDGGWDSEAVELPLVASKASIFSSDDNGVIEILINHSTAKTCYLTVVLPNGKGVLSDVITFAGAGE